MSNVTFKQEDGLEKRHYLYHAGMGIMASFYGTPEEFRRELKRSSRGNLVAVAAAAAVVALFVFVLHLNGRLS